jgi:hypothetical protein
VTRRLALLLVPALALVAAGPAAAAVPFTGRSISITKPMGIAAADVDADGATDLVTANSLEYKAGVLLGDGAGAFTAGLGSPLAIGGSASAVAAGDLNHDGRADLVIPDYQSGMMVDSDQVEIFLSTSSGFVAAPPLTSGVGTSDATIADFDADGHPDLAIANAVDDTLTIFLGDGTGSFTDAGTTATGTAYNALVATDFDSDGDLDLVTSGGGIGGSVVTLRNDGAGTLSVINTTPRPTGPASIAAADFDADGHPDIALAQTFGGGKIAVLHGDGTGTFGDAAEWSAGASPFQIIATDVDGDQRPDLAVTSYGGNLVRVLRNDALPAAGLAPAGAQDLGSVTVGTSSARTFAVSSSGTAALHAGTVAVTGAGFAKTADTCSGRIVANGSSCSVTVAFAPVAAGAAAGTLTIPTDDGPLVTALTATGAQTPEPPGPTPTPEPPAPEPPAPPTVDGGTPPSTPARCASRRVITITTPRRLRGGTITIAAGKRRIARIARAGATVKVDLTGVARGRIRVTLAKGEARDVRVYRTCTAKRT